MSGVQTNQEAQTKQGKEKERLELFNQIHEIADCSIKHFASAHVLTLEGVEAAIQKELDHKKTVAIHKQVNDLMRRFISLMLPDDKECLAKITELWQAVGWLNTAEEHMLDKYERYTREIKPAPQIKPLIEKLPLIIHTTRMIRKKLEKTLFQSITEAMLDNRKTLI